MTIQHIAFHLVSSHGQTVRLVPPQTYVCGRDETADVVVPDSLISRQHAELRWDDDAFWSIVDLGSRNGTIVNEQVIEGPQQLLDHAQIQFGGQVYTFFMTPEGVAVEELVREARRMGSADTIELDSREMEAYQPGFRGTVTREGLLDLIQFFTLTRRSGRLDLLSDDEEVGSIWFVNGAPRDACRGTFRGFDAVAQLAASEVEGFNFAESVPIPGAVTIPGSPDEVLMNLALAQDSPVEKSGAEDDREHAEPTAAESEAEAAADWMAEAESAATAEAEPAATAEAGSIAADAAGPADPAGPEPMEATPSAGVIASDPDANGIFAGRRFGNVELRCILGHGAMAQVYRASHELLGTDVAVKVMLVRGGIHDEKNRQRFTREARIAAGIKHDNVVQVMDAGISEEGNPYLVMELIEGPTLGRLLAEKGRMAFGELGRYAAGIADGLAAIHAKGVVHRDIKPDNVLIDSQGVAKLSDLGMARRQDDETAQRLTATGVVLGTPLYMAPEMVNGSHDSGTAADIYSFGVMLYHLLSGRPPYMGNTPYEIMRAHVNGDFVPLSDLVPELDKSVVKLIHQCMQAAPERRPDAVTLAEGLRSHQREGCTSDEFLSHVRVSKDLRKVAKAQRQAAAGPAASSTVKLVVLVVVAVLVLALIAVASVKG